MYNRPINLAIDQLKKGDVFADGLARMYDLEFIRKDEKYVYALHRGKEIKIDFEKQNLQENGYIAPRILEGDYAVGRPGERRREHLVLKKKAVKNCKSTDLYLIYRHDFKLTDCYCLEPFSNFVFSHYEKETLAKDGDLFVYVVEDEQFSLKESLEIADAERKEQLELLVRKVKDAENALFNAKNELSKFLGTK